MARFRWAIEVGCRRILVSSRIRFWYFQGDPSQALLQSHNYGHQKLTMENYDGWSSVPQPVVSRGLDRE
jgi:hypothetical protein